jgi:hypothetical protein
MKTPAKIASLSHRQVEEGELPGEKLPRQKTERWRGFPDEQTVLFNGYVEAGLSATITVMPSRTFRPERLVVPSNLAESFNITSIKIDGFEQMTWFPAETPAGMFNEEKHTKLHFDVCLEERPVSMTVRNLDTQDRVFTALLVGPT